MISQFEGIVKEDFQQYRENSQRYKDRRCRRTISIINRQLVTSNKMVRNSI